MRSRRTGTPLLPVNSKHLRSKSRSLECLRLVFLGAIFLVIGYTFLASKGPGHHRPEHHNIDDLHPAESEDLLGPTHQAQAHLPSSPPIHIETTQDSQAHESSLHLDHLAATEKAHQNVKLDLTQHNLNVINSQPQHVDATKHKLSAHHVAVEVHKHESEHKHHDHIEKPKPILKDRITTFPDATHQVHKEAHPADIPDATHQVELQNGERHLIQHGSHKEAENHHQQHTLQIPNPSTPDAQFIAHDKWTERDTKEPTATTIHTTTGVTIEADAPKVPVTGLYRLVAQDIDGHDRPLKEFQGKVVLVVNVASACGYTDENYKGLQALYEKYRHRGFEVLGFPCNQFGAQESGSLAEIKSFCTHKYHVTFPMFAKVDVNGPDAHPVYQFLRSNLPESEGGGGGHAQGLELTWNFNKFLVNQQGHPVRYYNQHFDGAALERDLSFLLDGTHDKQQLPMQ